MHALKARDVCRAYGRQRVLNGLSLDLAAGEFAALMGPSGSGKSTFLHVAAGLLRADAGSVEIAGVDVVRLGDTAATKFRRRSVGVVFQSFNLLETLSVADNIVLPLQLDRRPVDAERLAALVTRLGLSGLERRHPSELSGGERQRVAVARALIASPAVVLADEPTGNLDVASAHALCAELKELNETEKSAILLVTHDPVVAAAAQRVHFLKEGRVVASCATKNDPAEISARYLETYGRG
jgi:putative ABC transport system ATP-binding protein